MSIPSAGSGAANLPQQNILDLFLAGVRAADPYLAVQSCLHADNAQLHIDLGRESDQHQRSSAWPLVHVLAFGKAACAMAEAARSIIPPSKMAQPGLIVTTYDNVRAIENFQVIGAGHPLPDAAGLQAAQLLANRAAAARPGELLLVLVSGGGSALLPLPVVGISLPEKIATTNLLLACGANIQQINCVRKHLSQLKGGGLAKLAGCADLHALILSDVIGDDLSAIASGPTVPDDTRFADAIQVLKSFQVWTQTPPAVQHHLLAGLKNTELETPKTGADCFANNAQTLIGSNTISLDAVSRAAAAAGYQVDIYSRQLCGEAKLAAGELAAYVRQTQANGLNQPIAIIAGGETTVTLAGNDYGKGGRNQEMALAFAVAAEQHQLDDHWQFLSGGTDGRDGPTDAAGGVVDAETLKRIRAAGIDPETSLLQHNAYPALQAADALLITGATGTNVADLQIVLLHPNHK
ncbi:DUF4147 domain-containing protein [Methylomonas paludis]|uniref:DUF4147 domain-containing protein n=1 Tax=Methylomonas paludis TaxID=1173101 RepID=A0A975MPY9_9GAMM|nr:DUF4147 domain-containing protein [Methylomonas paludis]QWF71366.1 DUF4147 domain-containing protein [Methylomonas paludis]